ncbi:hypothetical protein GCM10011492_13360 [Flexivirga endophytica]|uniref:DUF4829 domain-containing protein n=1 Tax=Flexivirga endophytica TaxID=1849103 RepID=A0A916T263_9MICO|nr:hypothetical protein [Flexivirga endophytica]GGB24713.1 hypothetical protein GCM10011492_13360 [Flexivirga endophytica]GHB63425.1 hypothetical protein GCM10008112_35480 [Flexivirga endophytica]
MRRAQNIVGLGLVIVVLCGVFGLWLWGKPRSTVAVPPASSAPSHVVQTFAQALNDRDFSAAKDLVIGDRVGVDSKWWDLHGPRVEDLQILKTGAVTTGAQCGSEAAVAWKKCVQVRTEATFKHVKGVTNANKPDHERWTYYLVRNTGSERWRILDWGKG